MNSIYDALTTEYLRRLRFPWSMAVLVFIGGPIMFSGVGPYDYHATYLGTALLILPMITLVEQWQIYPHLYHRPISTRAMAGWLMATGTATIAGTHVLFLLAYRAMFGIRWPILPTTLFFVAFALLAQSINWNLLKTGFFKLLAGLAAIAGAVWWLARRYYPEGFHRPMQPWESVSLDELATMAAVSVGAALMGIRGLSSARHECHDHFDPNDPYDVMETYVGTRVPRLNDVPQTLGWFFGTRGMTYAVATAGAVIFPLGLLFAFARDDVFERTRPWESLVGMSLFVPLVICALVGLAIGLDVRHPVRQILMPFLSTRPVTTEQLSRSLLWSAFKSTLMAWGLLIVTFVLFCTGFFQWVTPGELLAEIRKTETGIATIPLNLVGSFLIAWVALSWMAVLGWSGRKKVMILGTVVIVGWPVSFQLIAYLLFPAFPSVLSKLVAYIGVWLPAIVIPLATSDLAGAARRGKLLSQKTLWLIVFLAVGMTAFFWILFPGEPWEKTLVCLYATAALLPIPMTPLMLEWNRHR